MVMLSYSKAGVVTICSKVFFRQGCHHSILHFLHVIIYEHLVPVFFSHRLK